VSATISQPTVPDTARSAGAIALQRLLPELVALTLDAKQAHWNVTGPRFLALHALTDDIATKARNWADRVAGRVMALGFAVDARPATVASVAGRFPTGRVVDHEAITALIGLIDGVTDTAGRSLDKLQQVDPVAHDLTIDILEGFGRYRWMLRAQLSS
jgi:starvation-inducible DNA-binding protein